MYCLKCKKATANAGKPVMTTTANGRRMAKSTCAVCGTKKSQFVKAGTK